MSYITLIPITNNVELSKFTVTWPTSNTMTNVQYSVEVSPLDTGSPIELHTASNFATLYFKYRTLYNVSIFQRYCREETDSEFTLGNYNISLYIKMI